MVTVFKSLMAGFGLQVKHGFVCCNCGVPSIHKGFSMVIGLELELLAWLSLLDSL